MVAQVKKAATNLNLEEEKMSTSTNRGQPKQALVTEADKYYKKFDFFYKRTCFRLMSEFYKLLFQPFQKLWIEQKKRSSMAALLHSFATKHFESIFGQLSAENQREFVRMIMAVVHSHRHNKDDVATDKEN